MARRFSVGIAAEIEQDLLLCKHWSCKTQANGLISIAEFGDRMSKLLGYSMTQKILGMWGQELTGRDTNIFWHKPTISLAVTLGCPSAGTHHSLAFLKKSSW